MQMGLPLVERAAAPEGIRADTAPLVSSRYFVRHRRARRYVLRVDPDGRVRVTIPRGGSRAQAEAFADRNDGWVQGQLTRLRDQPRRSPDAHAEIRTRARVDLPPLLLAWAHRLGLAVAAVSVRNQQTRWGSCGRNGHISLNWRLLLMPDWVRDYVLVHELMHLKRMDHSPKYWALVEAAYPRFQDARAWLRANGPALR